MTRRRLRGLEMVAGSTTRRRGHRPASKRCRLMAVRQFVCDAMRRVPAPSADGTTLYFSPRAFLNANEIHKASPEGGAAVPLTRYARSRVPFWPTGHALSRDGRWIAIPLKDGATTNIWAIPTSGGPFRQLTDFGRSCDPDCPSGVVVAGRQDYLRGRCRDRRRHRVARWHRHQPGGSSLRVRSDRFGGNGS